MATVIPFGNAQGNNVAKVQSQHGKKTLADIFAEIVADDSNKFDTEVEANSLLMTPEGRLTRGRGSMSMTDWATTQLASKLEIPVRYFKACPPELQAQNFNHWASQSDDRWLLRSRNLGGDGKLIRAVLSADKYGKLDNADITGMVQRMFPSSADYSVDMWHLDDAGFHLRMTMPDLTTDIGRLRDGRPDTHRVGVHIANSEVGKRSIIITPMVYRLVCTNGLMRWEATEGTYRRRHVITGVNAGASERIIYGEVAEAVGHALKAGNEIVETLRAAKETPVVNPLDVIKQLAADRKYSQVMTDAIQTSYAANVAQTGANAFSLVNAITESAQRTSHPDTRAEFEADAMTLLERLVTA
jgi:hypothetical protein